jgi:hypothetical protein
LIRRVIDWSSQEIAIAATLSRDNALADAEPWRGNDAPWSVDGGGGGLQICAPIHDALLFEAPIYQIDEQARAVAEIMAQASEIVLGPGKRCRSDNMIVRYPYSF